MSWRKVVVEVWVNDEPIDPVNIHTDIFNGISALWNQRRFIGDEVAWCRDNGYPDAAAWIEDNPKGYARACIKGIRAHPRLDAKYDFRK